MAELTVASITRSGLEPQLTAVNSSDKFANPATERTFLHVSNSGGGAVTVTIPAQTTSIKVAGAGSLDVDDIVVSVPVGEARMIGPFPSTHTDSDGNTTVNYSSTSSVTAQAIKLPIDSV